MKKILYGLVFIGFMGVSCNKEPQALTQAQMKQEIDALTKARIAESDRQAEKDLELRIKIEVKVKADSILNARLTKQVPDTTHKPPAPAAAIPPVRMPFKIK